MFTITAIAESVVVALAAALLYAMCALNALGALQQAGYSGRTFTVWLFRKGNMTRSRFTLLAFLTALSSLVLGICFSFLGKWAAYVALLPVPLFVGLYCMAEKDALKVPLKGTARVKRIYVLLVLVLAIVGYGLITAGNAAAYGSAIALIEPLRFLLLSILPLLLPWLLCVANWLEKLISGTKNRRYVQAAQQKLEKSRCVKIGITGSFAKTSVKNFLAQLLGQKYKVLVTPESYNTPLGIAKTVNEANLDEYDFFIAEMGARHVGDIAQLCSIVQPDHCILTGICAQHLETFKSLENVVCTKGEIFSGTKANGYAVYAMDEHSETLSERMRHLIKVPVGEHGECGALEVKCSDKGIAFKLALGIRQIECASKLLGAHNAQNIALAAAMAYKLGLSKEELSAGIAALEYVPHRLQPIEKLGVTILDDAYNANIRGAAGAIEVLRLFPGRKIVVTPGLVELGVLEAQENEALGARLVGLDRIVLIGATLVTSVKNGYLAAGGEADKIDLVPSLEKAQAFLETYLKPGDTVLFLNDLPDIYS